jgi:V/A-type H+-transporting ATPase subunit B
MNNKNLGIKEYRSLTEIKGPIIVLEDVRDVGYGELVEVIGSDGKVRKGRVLQIGEKYTFVQVFEGTQSLNIKETTVRFLGHPALMPVTKDMLGRIFSGSGNPLDKGPTPVSKIKRDINGLPINPASRTYPRDFIETGISAIDGMNTVIRGQKIAIFSGSGLPHNLLASQILSQSRLKGENVQFAIVFAGIGLRRDDANFFMEEFKSSDAALHTTMFINFADDPAEERLLTPRFALTLAEYLAFDEGLHVLVILTDITNYCEALRELSSAREEVPSRKGYPGYMYTDLASIYERTGRTKNSSGSITQIPILTMPNMDITHPIPDLTGYITEGQIALSLELHQKGIYPPIDVLPSLSRLMKDGIGKDKTRDDHPNLSSQLYYAYAQAKEARALASIIGEEELTPRDKAYLKFGRVFEKEFVSQKYDERRSVEDTLNLGWKILEVLPLTELHRVTREDIDKYFHK